MHTDTQRYLPFTDADIVGIRLVLGSMIAIYECEINRVRQCDDPMPDKIEAVKELEQLIAQVSRFMDMFPAGDE